MGREITFERADGGAASGYLTEAARPNAPGVVMVQEWWGLQGQIKRLADRLAGDGYNVLCPDLYEGAAVACHDTANAERLMDGLDHVSATDQQVYGAARYLARDGARIGLTGYCLGGVVTVLGALRIPEFAAASCFYGIPSPGLADPAAMRIPFQGHFASRDTWCLPTAVDVLEASLSDADCEWEIFRYEAEHGFMNDDLPDDYDAALTDKAWDRTLEFWAKHLDG